jgi:hypothetical protein
VSCRRNSGDTSQATVCRCCNCWTSLLPRVYRLQTQAPCRVPYFLCRLPATLLPVSLCTCAAPMGVLPKRVLRFISYAASLAAAPFTSATEITLVKAFFLLPGVRHLSYNCIACRLVAGTSNHGGHTCSLLDVLKAARRTAADAALHSWLLSGLAPHWRAMPYMRCHHS